MTYGKDEWAVFNALSCKCVNKPKGAPPATSYTCETCNKHWFKDPREGWVNL